MLSHNRRVCAKRGLASEKGMQRRSINRIFCPTQSGLVQDSVVKGQRMKYKYITLTHSHLSRPFAGDVNVLSCPECLCCLIRRFVIIPATCISTLFGLQISTPSQLRGVERLSACFLTYLYSISMSPGIQGEPYSVIARQWAI